MENRATSSFSDQSNRVEEAPTTSYRSTNSVVTEQVNPFGIPSKSAAIVVLR